MTWRRDWIKREYQTEGTRSTWAVVLMEVKKTVLDGLDRMS